MCGSQPPRCSPVSPTFWCSHPSVVLSHRAPGLVPMNSTIQQKGWFVASEVRLGRILQPLSSYSLPLASLTLGEASCPIMSNPMETPTWCGPTPLAGSHVSKLRSKSSSPRQALDDCSSSGHRDCGLMKNP